MNFLKRTGPVAIAMAVLCVALWVLVERLQGIALPALRAAFLAQPALHIDIALALTAVSFTALASYDVFAARIVAPGRVSVGRAALAGAAANAVSNTLGFPAVTASAVRYRLYRAVGLGWADITRIISLTAGAIALGFATMLAAALVLSPVFDSTATAMHKCIAGVALTAVLALLLLWLARRRRRIAAFGFQLVLPRARLVALQMGIGGIEMAAAVGALYILLPAGIAPSFAIFSVAVIVAVVLGIVSHAPGGIGVFEATILALLGGHARTETLAALLLYRLLYNIVPFLIAVVSFALFEGYTRKRTSV